MNSKKYLVLGILIVVVISFWFWQKGNMVADLQITELKIFEDFPVATTSPHNIALYTKSITDEKGMNRKLFLTLGTMENDEVVVRENLGKVHTNSFWDPNRCAQMLNIIGYNNIIFSDTFKNTEDSGFKTFVYNYDISKNILVGYKVNVSLQKLFTDGDKFYAISKKEGEWILYKLDFGKNTLIEVKKYQNNLDLITLGDSLKWCDKENKNCIEENSFNFLQKNPDFKFELKPENKVGYYILGLQPVK